MYKIKKGGKKSQWAVQPCDDTCTYCGDPPSQTTATNDMRLSNVDNLEMCYSCEDLFCGNCTHDCLDCSETVCVCCQYQCDLCHDYICNQCVQSVHQSKGKKQSYCMTCKEEIDEMTDSGEQELHNECKYQMHDVDDIENDKDYEYNSEDEEDDEEEEEEEI